MAVIIITRLFCPLLLLSLLVINASAHNYYSDNSSGTSNTAQGLLDQLPVKVDPLLYDNGLVNLGPFDQLTDQLLPSINNQPEGPAVSNLTRTLQQHCSDSSTKLYKYNIVPTAQPSSYDYKSNIVPTAQPSYDYKYNNIVPTAERSSYDYKYNIVPTAPEPSSYDYKYNNIVPTAQPSYEKPNQRPEGTENYVAPAKPDYEGQKTGDQGLIPSINTVGIQGVILCEAGVDYKYYPLKGAVARITCPYYSNANGYNNEHGYYSILSPKTDENGFFLTTLSVSELTDKSINLNECKAFLKSSPLESCNVPKGVGVDGANISVLRALTNEIYYSVGTLTFTSATQYSAPISNDPVSNDQYLAPTSPSGY
ncbi:LOW QUALITY PROTEIN: hypothetical protein TorRG33x02_319160 [Trema orientale]|uniref:Pollen Ole e 1 allergen and extensin family protein n=1 Tax=Trema orientale TaxID=63057 RepID=A0A2P5BJI5_TREOI|nr:LOW QUALITY PROTEIN: hypothetical protein TorRG33x02_319160 [Trema orientale]